MLRFSLFGFPVAVHWLFWITCLFLGGGINADSPEDYQHLIAFTSAAFVSVLIHELGHAFMQRKYGAFSHIMLVALGGMAIANRRFTRKQEIIVSLAGPLVQIAVGLVALLILRHSAGTVPFLVSFLASFALVSIVWGVFNLLPFFPMDGGHVLLNVLGPRNEKITYGIGIVGPALLAVGGLLIGSFFTAILLGMMAFENYQRFRGTQTGGMLYPR